MMAILPPTSPTTVIGGFSLAIITKEETKPDQLAVSQTATVPPCKRPTPLPSLALVHGHSRVPYIILITHLSG